MQRLTRLMYHYTSFTYLLPLKFAISFYLLSIFISISLSLLQQKLVGIEIQGVRKRNTGDVDGYILDDAKANVHIHLKEGKESATYFITLEHNTTYANGTTRPVVVIKNGTLPIGGVMFKEDFHLSELGMF